MIITDLPIETYHSSLPQWLSKTTLRLFEQRGPKWFKLYLDGHVSAPKPGGIEQGLALDYMLTEGMETYAKHVAVKPEKHDGRTKEGREWAAANADKTVISQEDALILQDAVEAVRSCWAWPQIEKQCIAQATIRRQARQLGIGLQSRPDWVDLQDGVILDLKKTRDLTAFGRQAIDLGYHLQAALGEWCLADDDVALQHAYLVAVEWERGARCMVYEIPRPVLQFASEQMRRLAVDIADRLANDAWTEGQDGPEDLPIPEWMMRRME